MNALQWNMRGYYANYDNLIYFTRLLKSDIILLQETKLKKKGCIKVSGFTAFEELLPLTDEDIAHGGVAILARPHFSPTRVELDTEIQAVAVRVRYITEMTFCSIYVQERDQISKEQLQGLINQLGQRFILAGDFNGHSPLWGHPDINRIGSLINEIYDENDLVLLNDCDQPTYFNKRYHSFSTLDLTLTSTTLSDLPFDWLVYEDSGNSDHFPISFNTQPIHVV